MNQLKFLDWLANPKQIPRDFKLEDLPEVEEEKGDFIYEDPTKVVGGKVVKMGECMHISLVTEDAPSLTEEEEDEKVDDFKEDE